MALIHRKLFTWFLLLLFLILAGLRLDGRTHWNWLVVMVPVWLFDVLLLLHIALLTVSDCRAAFFGLDPLPERIKAVAYRLYQVLLTLLKMTFLVMLCVNLNHESTTQNKPISWYIVFAQLLVMMTCLCANTFVILIKPNSRYRD